MGEVTPYNRIENFLAKGSGAPVAPYNRMERILAGEDLEPTNRLEYFAKEAASGGGNPNSVQVITGTLATFLADIENADLSVASIMSSLNNDEASANICVDASAISMGEYTIPFQTWPNNTGIGVATSSWVPTDGSFGMAFGLLFPVEGIGFFHAYDSGATQDLSSYMEYIPYTLTIIWHPLPT